MIGSYGTTHGLRSWRGRSGAVRSLTALTLTCCLSLLALGCAQNQLLATATTSRDLSLLVLRLQTAETAGHTKGLISDATDADFRARTIQLADAGLDLDAAVRASDGAKASQQLNFLVGVVDGIAFNDLDVFGESDAQQTLKLELQALLSSIKTVATALAGRAGGN